MEQEHSLVNSVANAYAFAMDPDRDEEPAQIPNLYSPPPQCPRCGSNVTPLPAEDGWRCDECRLMWDRSGRHGQPDDRSPLARLREAYLAFGRMDIGQGELSDAVHEYLRAAEELREELRGVVAELSEIHTAPGYAGPLVEVIRRLTEVAG